MQSASLENLVLVLFVSGTLLFLLVLVWFFRRSRAKQAEKLLERYPKSELLGASDRANFFGVKSHGCRQLRGNGFLFYTKREIFFQLWMSRREVIIPLDKITSVDNVRVFLGRSRMKPLLRVGFTNTAGKQDYCAWLVRDLEKWTQSIKAACGIQ